MYLRANFSAQEEKKRGDFSKRNYTILCQECDKILLDYKSNIHTNAISWLHIIREHPAVLKQYYDLFQKNLDILIFFYRIKQKFINIGGLIKIFIFSLFKKNRYFDIFRSKSRKTDIIFISHFLFKSQIHSKEDFYFGNVPNNLKKYGINSLIALINHTGKECDLLSKDWNKKNSIQRVILSNTINFIDELRILFGLIKESLRLKKLAKKEKFHFKKKVLLKAAEESSTNRSMINLRLAFQVKKLVTKTNPKILIITHEGHSFERIIFAYARQAKKNIICIGYQHAIIFKLQSSIYLKLKKIYNPDMILTSGLTGKNILKSSKTLKDIPIKIFGSNRFIENKVKNKFRTKIIRKYKKNKNVCLVLPEGLITECYTLFDFSLKCAIKFPSIKFIWRLHPGIDFDTQVNHRRRYKDIPTNIILSSRSLEDDFLDSDWALYRGTTTIIQALICGLKPMYLELPSEFNIDPLEKMNSWKSVVRNIGDFKKTIKNQYSDEWSKKKWLKSKIYCNNFFKPFNDKVLIDIIKDIE